MTFVRSSATSAAPTVVSSAPKSTQLVSTVTVSAKSTSVKTIEASAVKPSTSTAVAAPSIAKVTSTSSSAVASTTAVVSSGTLGPLGGVNTAGYDFSVYTDGSFSGTGIPPPTSQYAHFASQGVNIFRIPFAWQLMTPILGGSIDETWFATFDATVQSALTASTSPYVILDLHNYARWNGGIIGQGGPTNDQFANLWSQIATKYASDDKIIVGSSFSFVSVCTAHTKQFGIMNEPHDLPSLSEWATSVQAAITAIRAAGAKTQYILMHHWQQFKDVLTARRPHSYVTRNGPSRPIIFGSTPPKSKSGLRFRPASQGGLRDASARAHSIAEMPPFHTLNTKLFNL
ncbi:hypothetical protein HWV62_20478 [Athelia sp. TMB]|nr:hypothetical protein HWV62_20478 [Athelia sp. TMB]